VAAEYRYGEVGLWSVATGTLARVLRIPIEQPRSMNFWRALAFSPDGERLYGVGADGRVCEWDSESGALLAARPFEEAYALAVDPGASLLAVVCSAHCHVLADLKGPLLASIAGPTMGPVAFRSGYLAVGPRLYRLAGGG
jgi:WD40 repeat protein